MPDTRRSLADLQAIINDNTAGDISAQDVRDFLVSVCLPQTLNGFRVTPQSGVSRISSDQTGATSVHITPDHHNVIGLYDGTSWYPMVSGEVSLALGTLTSGAVYDVFAYNNSGTLTGELSAAWTNPTTRADAITQQNGVWVKSSATTRRHLATLFATSTTTTGIRFGGTTTNVGGLLGIWNRDNQIDFKLRVIDTVDNYGYANGTIRAANGAGGNKVDYVCGDPSETVEAFVNAIWFGQSNAARAANAGVGIDSTTVFSGLVGEGYVAATVGAISPMTGKYAGKPGIGYHEVWWLEKGADGTSTFFGDDGTPGQSGLVLSIKG